MAIEEFLNLGGLEIWGCKYFMVWLVGWPIREKKDVGGTQGCAFGCCKLRSILARELDNYC